MKEKLNYYHIAMLIYMIELDVTIFALPRIVAVRIGTNGWVAVIALCGVAIINILLYKLVYRMGKGKTLFQIMGSALPKIVLYPFYCLLAAFWIALGSFIGKYFVLIFQMQTFQTSNAMLIFLLYGGMVFALLIKDLYSIVKAATVFFLLTFWLLILAPYFFQEWSIVRLTGSLFQATPHGHSLMGWVEVYSIFVGYELCIFLFPYSGPKSKLFKGVIMGHLLVASLQVLVILISFGFFSFQEVQVLEFPMIQTLEYIELPFINRVENLVFPFFVYSNLVTSVMFCFAGLECLRQVFPKARPKLLEGIISVALVVFGFFPSIIRDAEALLQVSYTVEIVIAISLPLLLILILQYNRWFGKGAKG